MRVCNYFFHNSEKSYTETNDNVFCPYLIYRLSRTKSIFMEIVILVIVAVFFFFTGFLLGGTNKGYMVDITNELPRVLFSVVYTDKGCTLLKEVGIGERRFLVSTKVFGGKPVRPKDQVRFVKNYKEQQELDIPNLGYPPLVKQQA